MKQKLIALGLIGATAATVTLFPILEDAGATQKRLAKPTGAPVAAPVPANSPRIDVVFALDTTGSMGGLIQAAKEKIWSIATTMASAQNAPQIRIGLVAYRDRGDQYVTRTVDLSSDLDSMYATLMDFKAGGGGDGPESVNAALHDAVTRMSWSQDPNAYKVVFLVGDAPAHMDYQDDVKYPTTLKLAKSRGIVVNAIQCGTNRSATQNWQRIAQLGHGAYFRVNQNGGAIAVNTPFDKKISALSRKLDESRLTYGDKEAKARGRARQKATRKLHAASSPASQARRAAFNSTKSGEANLYGEQDLAADVVAGKVELSTVAPAALPERLRKMAPAEREAEVAKTVTERQNLRNEIKELAQKREAFLKKAVKGKDKDSLDRKMFDAVRSQSAAKGLRYDADAIKY